MRNAIFDDTLKAKMIGRSWRIKRSDPKFNPDTFNQSVAGLHARGFVISKLSGVRGVLC